MIGVSCKHRPLKGLKLYDRKERDGNRKETGVTYKKRTKAGQREMSAAMETYVTILECTLISFCIWYCDIARFFSSAAPIVSSLVEKPKEREREKSEE